MLKKYTLYVYAFFLLAISLFNNVTEATPKINLHDYVSEQTFSSFHTFCKELEKKVKELSNNGKGCLLNLLDSQFYLFDLMEKELKNGNPNEEKIKAMMEGFQKALETFEAQCDEATKEIYEEIQKNIAMLIPQELASEIQTLQEEMQKAYTKAKEKNQLSNKDFENKMMTLQTELMQKFVHIQAITSIASLEIYEMIYTITEQKSKELKSKSPKNHSLLLRRFDVQGLVSLANRKKEVTNPKRAHELINSFLSQANAVSQDNTK